MLFGSKEEVLFAHADGELSTHDRVMLANPDFGRPSVYGDPIKKVIETTVGRVLFSEIWPEELGFPNKPIGKSQLGDLIWRCYKVSGQSGLPAPKKPRAKSQLGNLIWRCYKVAGHDRTVQTLDKLKELGFREAT